MYRLRQLKAYALGETSQEPVIVVEKDPVYAQLEASDVPVSFAGCRICPDPCDEGIPTIFLGAVSPLYNIFHERRP